MTATTPQDENEVGTKGKESMKDATISTRINADLKKEGDAVLKELGISTSAAITTLYRFLAQHKRMPVTSEYVTMDQAVKSVFITKTDVSGLESTDLLEAVLANTAPGVKITLNK